MILRTLEIHGLPSAGYRSKSWGEFTGPTIDLVITACDNAAGEAMPALSGWSTQGALGVPDPADATGNPAEIQAVFNAVDDQIERRIKALVALPAEMPREALASVLNTIGELP